MAEFSKKETEDEREKINVKRFLWSYCFEFN